MSLYTPFHLILTGTLQGVLVDGVAVEATVPHNNPGLLQALRYSCASEAWARLVRIVVKTPDKPDWRITPLGAKDEVKCMRHIPDAGRLSIRVERGENVDPLALPDLSNVDFRLEVIG